MGAFVSNNNWYSSSNTDGNSLIYYTGGTTSGFGLYQNTQFVYGVKASIDAILKTVYDEIKSFCDKSPNFDGSLKGFSAIASRMLAKALVDEGYDSNKIKFGYIHNQYCSHVFVTLDWYEDYILDLCAAQFGCDPLNKTKVTDTHPDSDPWWDAQTLYESESGLIARQRKDGWPEHQITLKAARAKPKPRFNITTKGDSDLSVLRLRVAPVDNAATKYLGKIAKRDGLRTNLAALLLDSDPELVKLATQIAKKLG